MHKKTARYKKTGGHPDLKKTGFAIKPTAIGDLLGRRPLFRDLAATLGPQEQWRQWLGETLPAELAEHLVSVVLKPPELIVYADGAAWGTRLRYALAALADAIRARDAAFTQTVVRVMPRQGSAPRR